MGKEKRGHIVLEVYKKVWDQANESGRKGRRARRELYSMAWDEPANLKRVRRLGAEEAYHKGIQDMCNSLIGVIRSHPTALKNCDGIAIKKIEEGLKEPTLR